MSYKTILVYFRGESEAEALCIAAEQIAARQEAHVIGLFVLPNVEALPVMGFPVPAGIKESYANVHLQWAEGARVHFDRFAKNRPDWEWRQIDSGTSTISRVLADHACIHQLTANARPLFPVLRHQGFHETLGVDIRVVQQSGFERRASLRGFAGMVPAAHRILSDQATEKSVNDQQGPDEDAQNCKLARGGDAAEEFKNLIQKTLHGI